jgi:hypothetical protein
VHIIVLLSSIIIPENLEFSCLYCIKIIHIFIHRLCCRNFLPRDYEIAAKKLDGYRFRPVWRYKSVFISAWTQAAGVITQN